MSSLDEVVSSLDENIALRGAIDELPARLTLHLAAVSRAVIDKQSSWSAVDKALDALNEEIAVAKLALSQLMKG